MNLSEQTLKAIEREIASFPQKRSAMMNVLHLVQEDQGYISEAAMEWVAGQLDCEPIHVLEVVTFYPMYRQKPVGKVHLNVCRTLSCALGGCYHTKDKLAEALGCDIGKTSEDGNFSLDWASVWAVAARHLSCTSTARFTKVSPLIVRTHSSKNSKALSTRNPSPSRNRAPRSMRASRH